MKLIPCVHVFEILDFVIPQYEFCPANQTSITEPGQDTAVVVWSEPIATDNSNKEPDITCNPKSGTRFPIGKTMVNCTAEDNSGNKAECSFFVDIRGKSLQVTIFAISLIIQPSTRFKEKEYLKYGDEAANQDKHLGFHLLKVQGLILFQNLVFCFTS